MEDMDRFSPSTYAASKKYTDTHGSGGTAVQSDWEETDTTADDYIKNKPELGTAALKDSTNAVTENSTDLLESGAAYAALANKVDKAEGKGLSTNDYTAADKAAVANAAAVIPSTASTSNKLSTASDTAGEEIASSATGTSIAITDSADGYVQGITVKGKSRTTKNLAYSQSYNTQIAHCKTGKTYTFSISPTVGYNLYKNNNNGDVVASKYDGTPSTFTADEDFELYFNPYSTDYNTIQLELGSTATAYEPYFSGIKSIGDNGFEIETSGKNIFNPNNVIDAYISGEDVIVIASGFTAKVIFAKCKPNTTYTVSKIAGQRFSVGTTDSVPTLGTEVKQKVADSTAATITITTSTTAKYIVAYVYNSNNDPITAEQMLASCQIEVGSSASTYEPYKPITAATITTGLPLRSVSDTIFDTADNDKVVKKCAEVDLGTIPFTYNDTYQFFNSDTIDSLKFDGSLLCENYTFVGRASIQQMETVENMSIAIYDNYIRIKNTAYTDAATFITAMSGVKLIYELATPTETPLSTAEKSALASLRTYNPNTNIDATDSPSMTADYLLNTDNGKAVARVDEKSRETVLYAAADNVGTAIVTNDTISLSDDIRNYRSIKIEWAYSVSMYNTYVALQSEYSTRLLQDTKTLNEAQTYSNLEVFMSGYDAMGVGFVLSAYDTLTIKEITGSPTAAYIRRVVGIT